MQALPQAAFLLFLELATGGAIALFWVHLRREVPTGYTQFTGACLCIAAGLAVWLRVVFPPAVADVADQVLAAGQYAVGLAFVVVFAVYLVGLRVRQWQALVGLLGPVVPLLGLVALWLAALVGRGPQLFGLGAPLAVLAGAMALGSAADGLSLGHWYLVSPTLSVRPLIRLNFLCLGALGAQLVLLPALLFLPGPSPEHIQALFSEYAIFLGVRALFGLAIPIIAAIMTWRTARIRSLDSATGLLYIVTALILAGEIAARSLYALTGIAT